MAKQDYRAGLSKRRADVSTMFDHVAARYDLMNDLMTLGIDRYWRRLLVRAVDPQPGQRVLDLAAGTGTSSRPFADRGAVVVPTDISIGMLQVGRTRQPDLSFIAGDALGLPFADDSFDAVTISYGLRNVEHTEAALAELLRVTKPGGRLVIAEFSTLTWAPFRELYENYVMAGLPKMASLVSSNPQAYHYLAESILAWPSQDKLAEMMARSGWQGVEWRNLTGGIVALHRGWA